jgi:hypothetical protein
MQTFNYRALVLLLVSMHDITCRQWCSLYSLQYLYSLVGMHACRNS